MKHIWEENSELSVCTVCHLYEGGLTTDCPGEPSANKSEEIYSRKLDYREGEGWVNKFSPMMQMSIYSKLFDMYSQKEDCFKSEAELAIRFGASKQEIDEIKSKLVKDIYAR